MTAPAPITLAKDRDPWDKQPRETEKKHGYFLEFVKLGRARTLKKTATSLNLTHRSVQEDSYRYRWTERAQAFDRHMDDQWKAALFENSKRMVQEHLRAGRELLAKANSALEAFDPTGMSATDITRFMDMYSRLTRVALGEPETSVAITGHPGGAPIVVQAVPADEATRQSQMEAAVAELARRVGAGADLDAEEVLTTL